MSLFEALGRSVTHHVLYSNEMMLTDVARQEEPASVAEGHLTHLCAVI